MFDLAASLFAAFAYGVSGSLHCVAMCGPLAMLSSSLAVPRTIALPILEQSLRQTPQQDSRQRWRRLGSVGPWAYQGARVMGYAALGAIFGGVGQAIDLSLGVTVSKLLPYALVTLLLGAAFNLGRWVRLPAFPAVRRVLPTGRLSLPLGIGAMTALIPCGFLYSTAPLAIATGSAAGGALVLVAFALGTAPILLAATLMGDASGRHLRLFARLRRPLLLLAAVIILGRTLLLQPSAAPSAQTPRCHGQASS